MSREIREYGENLDSSNGRDIWEGREGRPLGERPLDEASFGGESEEAFLGRIRRRMRRAGVPTAHPGSDVWPLGHEERWRYPLKAELFVRTLEALGGHALRANDQNEAFALIRDALVERGVEGVLTSGGDWSALRGVLGEAGISVDGWDEIAFGPGEADREITRVDRWGAGITWVDFAVADTGSVVIRSQERQGRSVSLLPPLFIALISADALVHSRRAVLELMAEASKNQGAPSSLTFVTGPSRSADIENDLSIGVHGPGEVIAILIEQ